ncbi:MAG: hypothetical protein AAGH15_25735 [Myxococcota bacterium]
MSKSHLLTVGLAAMFGYLAACATRAALPTSTAQAYPPVPGQFTECTAVSLWMGRGVNLNERGTIAQTVRVPPGWSVVGGGARPQNFEGVMIICR